MSLSDSITVDPWDTSSDTLISDGSASPTNYFRMRHVVFYDRGTNEPPIRLEKAAFGYRRTDQATNRYDFVARSGEKDYFLVTAALSTNAPPALQVSVEGCAPLAFGPISSEVISNWVDAAPGLQTLIVTSNRFVTVTGGIIPAKVILSSEEVPIPRSRAFRAYQDRPIRIYSDGTVEPR